MIDEFSIAQIVESADVIRHAPIRTELYGVHYEITIPIGPDHVAHLTMDDDALFELCERNDLVCDTILGERLK